MQEKHNNKPTSTHLEHPHKHKCASFPLTHLLHQRNGRKHRRSQNSVCRTKQHSMVQRNNRPYFSNRTVDEETRPRSAAPHPRLSSSLSVMRHKHESTRPQSPGTQNFIGGRTLTVIKNRSPRSGSSGGGDQAAATFTPQWSVDKKWS